MLAQHSSSQRQSGRTALYEAAMISSGGITNRIDRLENAGLVERRPNPADKRVTLVALMADGLALIDRTVAAHIANQQRLVSGLDAQERAQLAALLGKLIRSQQNAGGV